MNALVRTSLLLAAVVMLTPHKTAGEEDALKNLKLPGVKIDAKERYLDVTAMVCLEEGSLEFIACTKDTKDHESIVTIEARPSHIHTGLLLLGAKAGHPAIRKVVGEGDDERWIDLPPKGSPVAISLVITGDDGKPVERPLTDFITRSEEDEDEDTKKAALARLKSFLFAGSFLIDREEGPRTYAADKSGSVISLSTFGDELLCLPEIYGHENHALQWEVDSTHLPKVGTQIILRLRPVPNS